MEQLIRTRVYVDGFNLYYGCLKDSKFKWLDLSELVLKFAKQNQINSIKYFSARVSSRPDDPTQHQRQQIYWRALRTIGCLEIIEGHFLSHPYNMPCIGTDNKVIGGKYARVMRTEEKGSDVNLATHLLMDAFDNLYDLAIVISNDSDLLMPIQSVRERFRKKIMILNGHGSKPSNELKSNSDFFLNITPTNLGMSQFPISVMDAKGIFSKPTRW